MELKLQMHQQLRPLGILFGVDVEADLVFHLSLECK